MSSPTKPVEQKARELLACPFCRSTNVFLARIPIGIASPNVACMDCGARGPGKRPGPECEQEAIEAWNTRALNTDGERIRRLEEALKEMVYETTHLSPCEVNGSHRCIISAEALKQAREALSTPSKGVG